jgi:hypothetical protein
MNDHDRRTDPGRARLGRVAVLLALATGLLAACSGTGGGTGAGEQPGASPGSTVTRLTRVPPSSVAPPTSRRSPEAPPPTTGPPLATTTKPEIIEPPNRELVRVRGRVAGGVEPGCIVLKADDGATWLLLDLRAPPPSGVVQVSGYAVPGLATTCQEGRPLRVVSILAP